MIIITINITSVGVQSCNAFILTLGYGGTQWCPVEPMCTSAFLSVSLFGLPHRFLAIIKAWPVIVRSA